MRVKNKKLKTHLLAAQNKCIRLCLKLNDRSSIKLREFEKINWLPVHERISQCSLCNVYKFFANKCPEYFDELFFPQETNRINTRYSYQKLTLPKRTTNTGQKALSYTGPALWNNLDKNLKTSSSLNIFKHKIKEYYFNELKKKESQ